MEDEGLQKGKEGSPTGLCRGRLIGRSADPRGSLRQRLRHACSASAEQLLGSGGGGIVGGEVLL